MHCLPSQARLMQSGTSVEIGCPPALRHCSVLRLKPPHRHCKRYGSSVGARNADLMAIARVCYSMVRPALLLRHTLCPSAEAHAMECEHRVSNHSLCVAGAQPIVKMEQDAWPLLEEEVQTRSSSHGTTANTLDSGSGGSGDSCFTQQVLRSVSCKATALCSRCKLRNGPSPLSDASLIFFESHRLPEIVKVL